MTLRLLSLITACALVASAVPAAETKAGPVLYENNFEQAAIDSVPADFLVLDGAFAVKEAEGRKFLQLPGAPLDTFGVLFGPNEPANVAVSANLHGTVRGRRMPTFGIGLNGNGIYKLQLAPAKKAVELYKGEEVVASAPYDWESGSWTTLKLSLRKKGEEYLLEGRVWKAGATEPAGALLHYTDKTAPPSGRASIWGMPYAGTPIGFDDLRVTRLE